MKRLTWISLVLLSLLAIVVIVEHNLSTYRRLDTRQAEFEGIVAKAGLIGKSELDVKKYLSKRGMSYNSYDKEGARGFHRRVTADTAEVGWTLTPHSGHQTWCVTLVFDFDKSGKRLLHYHVVGWREKWSALDTP